MFDFDHPQTDPGSDNGASWSPNDELLLELEQHRGLGNSQLVTLMVGLGSMRAGAPTFLPLEAVRTSRLLVPTAGGDPFVGGRLRVLPVFTDWEALEAWLPGRGGHQHPCFGAPADGVTTALGGELSDLRRQGNAVAVVANPAGPGAYQIDPEEPWGRSSSNVVMAGSATGLLVASAPSSGTTWVPSSPIHESQPLIPSVRHMVNPDDRRLRRRELDELLKRAVDQAEAGAATEAIRTLADADQQAESMNDYVRRARALIMAATLMGGMGRPKPTRELAHYAVLAAGLTGHGPMELEAKRLMTDSGGIEPAPSLLSLHVSDSLSDRRALG